MSADGSQSGLTIWLTGLPCSGKTTIAQQLERGLRAGGNRVEVLDGDLLRVNLNKGLGFSKDHRDINVRRIAFVANLLSRNQVAVIVAAISPYRAARAEARHLIGNFVEVFVDCSLDTLMQRDVKGLYRKALSGEIPNFTGISDPYEPPLTAEVVVRTDQESVEESCAKIINKLAELGYKFPGLQPPVRLQSGD